MRTQDVPDSHILSVSKLNLLARSLLEDAFASVWVEGEISNFAAPHSGHYYFTLKDPTAQIKCALFRGNQKRLGFTPKDGMHVLVRGRVSLYENRGDYQLIAETMEERGEGKLRRAFELLRAKLEAAGLFAPEKKKPLPLYPARIGVITSSTGAAIRDILNVLKRRFTSANVIIYPTLVQGETAAKAIVTALTIANQRNECDVLILARGGGSLEDLWPFNEEIVAHAIAASSIPLISGIGHEVDFTIADFVADLRAPTPSAAAELVTPDQAELLNTLRQAYFQLQRQMRAGLQRKTQQLQWTNKRLEAEHPKRRLIEKMQRLDLFEAALTRLHLKLITQRKMQTLQDWQHLLRLSPQYLIERKQQQLAVLTQHLNNAINKHVQKNTLQLETLAAKLHALSPLATLDRGFALASTPKGRIIRSVTEVETGDALTLRFADGSVDCKVE